VEEIRQLYISEGRSLKSVLEYLETQYEVKATYVPLCIPRFYVQMQPVLTCTSGFSVDQFKKLAKRQGWRKNFALRDDEWSHLSAVIEKRKRDGKETQVLVNGDVVDGEKVKRSLKRHRRNMQATGEDIGEGKASPKTR